MSQSFLNIETEIGNKAERIFGYEIYAYLYLIMPFFILRGVSGEFGGENTHLETRHVAK